MSVKNQAEKLIRRDENFHETCKVIGKNSKCMSRQIGTIMVRDDATVSTGYNGPPRGVPHCDSIERKQSIKSILKERFKDKKNNFKSLVELGYTNIIDKIDSEWGTKCPRQIMNYASGDGLEWCVAGHAERNCLINAAREGIPTKGAKLYMDCGIPCTPCLVEIVNAGIEEIIVTKKKFYDVSAEYILKESHLAVRIFSHLCEHTDWKEYSISIPDFPFCRDCWKYML